jgi:hypothetical protein
MRKCDEYLACSGYRYAPEQFKAYRITGFSNGNHNVPLYEQIELDYEETRECGMALCIGNTKEAIAKLKTILCKREQKSKRHITYGFVHVDNPKRYSYVQQRWISHDAKIDDKLYLFKFVKDQMEHNNWETEPVVMEEAVLGAGFSVESKTTRTLAEKINTNKPCKIYEKMERFA